MPALFDVARKYHVPMAELLRLNHLKHAETVDRVGLLLPDTASTSALPFYQPWRPAPPTVRCKVQAWKFTETSKTSHFPRYCAQGGKGESVCISKDDAAKEWVQWSRAEKTLTLPISVSRFNPWGSSLVDVSQVDLDGDGAPETLLSWLVAVSNGLGEEYRTLVVIKDGKEWLRYDSGYLSARDALVRVGGHCHLAAKRWDEARDPLLGDGWYSVERSFDPTSLHMDAALPGQRMRRGSMRELLPPTALEVETELPVRGEVGVIVAMETQAERANSDGDFVDNRALTVRIGAEMRVLRNDASANPSLRFGDARSGVLLPEEFWSASQLGRHVRLSASAPDRAPKTVIWLVD